MPTSDRKPWITAGEAARRLGFTNAIVARLAEQGRLGILEVPGIKGRRYSAADVDRLVAESSRPATVNKAEALVASKN